MTTPLDWSMNHAKPIQCYCVYEWDGKIYGHVVDWCTSWEAAKRYSYHYELKGKEAHYFIVTDNADVTRQIAIDFAKALHERKFRTIHTDAAQC